MKRTLMIFAAILGGIFILLSLLDNSDYALEKKLWRLKKQVDTAAKDPKVVPDREYDDLAIQYRKLIKKYPDSDLIPELYLKIGFLYGLKKDFNKARAALEEVLKLYPDNKALCSLALLNIGNIYDSENDEKKAIAIYKQVLREYPLTDLGLNMPLHIANYYLRKEKSEEYKEAIDNAAHYYKRQAKKNPNSEIEFNSLRLLVMTYYAKEDWGSAVDTLGNILLKYASSSYLNPTRAGIMLKSINTISVTKLRDYDRPKVIYRKFIEQNPKHPLGKALQQMIDSLQQLDDANVYVKPKN